MSVKSSQAIAVGFTTSNPSTQAAVNADSLPTGTLYLNGVSNAATVTVTNLATGLYKAAVTLPTLALTDVVELVISATVATIAGKAVVWRDTVAALVSGVVWDEVLTSVTHNVVSSSGRLLRSINPNSDAIYSGTLPSQAGMTSTQIKLDAGASAVTGIYSYNVVSITGGTDAGDSRVLTSYDGPTRVGTVDRAWTVQPDATSIFDITATASSRVVSYIAGQDPATLVWAAATRTLTASPAINLAQTLGAARALDAVADTALTLNDALHCAVAAAAGKESVVDTAYLVKTPFTGTVLRSFTLDASVNPATRN
jgi:hypothetical protein